MLCVCVSVCVYLPVLCFVGVRGREGGAGVAEGCEKGPVGSGARPAGP